MDEGDPDAGRGGLGRRDGNRGRHSRQCVNDVLEMADHTLPPMSTLQESMRTNLWLYTSLLHCHGRLMIPRTRIIWVLHQDSQPNHFSPRLRHEAPVTDRYQQPVRRGLRTDMLDMASSHHYRLCAGLGIQI
jgi:hypothetical protein